MASNIELESLALIYAVQQGDLALVKKCIERGTVVCHGVAHHPTNKNGRTYLHLAVCSQKPEIVEYLIQERNVDVNQRCAEGVTSLHRAAGMGYFEIVKLLVEHGADCNSVDDHDNSPCYRAAQKGFGNIIEFLVKQGKADINKCNLCGLSPLMYAAIFIEDVEFLKLLIDLGADYTARDPQGQSVFQHAAVSGDVDKVKFLVEEKHLDPNASTANGLNLLHILLSVNFDELEVLGHSKELKLKNNAKVIDYLVKKRKVNVNKVMDGGITPLDLACEHRDLKIVELLIEEGADCNARDDRGNSSLHRAARFGKVDIIKYLIEAKNARVNERNLKGETPLHCACAFGNLDCVKLLLDNGADIKAVDNRARYCMHYAAFGGGSDVVKYLAEVEKLHVHRGDKTGTTPLLIAAGCGHLKVCKLLVDLGADYVSRDCMGNSCLHLAAGQGHVNIVQYFLIELGQSDVNNCLNIARATPLHFACMSDQLDCVKLLLENGADYKRLDNDGKSCLRWAAATPNRRVYEYLVQKMNLQGDVLLNSFQISPLERMLVQNMNNIAKNDCHIS